jgi:hypothetical protein
MRDAVPDLLTGAGFVSLAVGIYIVLGLGATFVIGGALIMAIGIVGAWRRSSS